MKKLISVLLVCACLFSFGPPAFASGFADISDSRTQENVAVLQAMGVVDGMPDGTFQPSATLTRAQFCKMAVTVMGNSSSVPQYQAYTIFPDVRASHWAAGYINLAARGENKFIAGNPDGTFRPDDRITFAQAATILTRLLGYADSDVGTVWPEGYLNTAQAAGLTSGVSLSPGDPVTRAQAAQLFCNLLSAKLKGSESTYLSKVAGSVVADAVFLSVSATASDGTANAVKTSTGTYKTNGTAASSAFLGCRGTLALDKAGRFLTFLPDRTGSSQTVILSSCGYNYIKTNTGETISVSKDAQVYIGDAAAASFGTGWVNLKSGDQVKVYYNAAGEAESLFVDSFASEVALVAKNEVTGNPFSSLVSGVGSYQMLKNGAPVDASAIRRYDVATYDPASKILYISDKRFTGLCQSVYPNLETPSTITVLGHSFDILASAMSDLSSAEVGESITLLLTADYKVAGAVSSSIVQANMVGIATAASAGSATVELMSGITLSGSANLSAASAAALVGQLVTVGSYNREKMTLSKLSGSETGSVFYVQEKKLGSLSLAQNIQIFEQVGNSALTRIELDDLVQEKIPASQVKYVEKDYAGNISILILNDVTGDRYTYGFFRYTSGTDTDAATVTIENGSDTSFPTLKTITSYRGGDAGGLVKGLNGMVAGAVTLTRLSGVSRAAFSGEDSVSTNSMVLPISDDVKCYISSSDSWVDLNTVLAFSGELYVYYDRAPEQGGKVRLIVAA
jgi:hypothetical protein